MAEIFTFQRKAETPRAIVELSDNFCEQTCRQLGLKGKLLGPDGSQENVSRILIEGEDIPARVHVQDYTIIN